MIFYRTFRRIYRLDRMGKLFGGLSSEYIHTYIHLFVVYFFCFFFVLAFYISRVPPSLSLSPDWYLLSIPPSSPPFRAAVSNLDQALRTGLLGGMVRQLGLPEEAGTGVGAFLRAVQEQGDRQNANREREGGSGGDRMDTD
jgi:hypothetical protein